MKQEIKERIERIRNGEVPEGYKETNVGIIPLDWTLDNLKIHVSSFIVPMRDKPNVFSGDIPWCRIEDFQGKYLEKSLSNQNVSKETIDEMNLKVYPNGTVLCSCSARLGICTIVKKPLVTNQTFIGLVPKEELDNEFLYYFMGFKSEKLQKLSSGTTISYLSREEFEKFPITYTSIKEQKNIISIISTWDKVIELKEKLIEEKKELKKGFMQKLLFKRVTRNILWNETQLRKCLIPTSYPVNKPSEPYYALGIRSHCKGTLVRHIEDPEKIAMDTLYELKENELIVNITFAWEGAITLLSKKDEGKLVSHRFPTYNFNKEYTIPDYFKHLVKTKWFVFQLGLLSPGGAGRNRVLNKTDFLNLKVLLPSVEEQRKIADFLNSLDNEFDLLNKELNQLKEQKRGLMQLLLTGIVRVEVN